MKKYILLICVLLSFTYAQAQTNISGQIRSNTTWTKAGSPYILSGLVELAPKTTLTIEPGVIVQIDFRFDVHGDIKATGSITDSVQFISSSSIKAYRVHLIDSNITDTQNFSMCSFKGISLYVNGVRTNVVVHNSSFIPPINGSAYAINQSGSGIDNIEIDNCKFIKCSIRSLYNSGLVKITNCHFESGSINMLEADRVIIKDNFVNGIFCEFDNYDKTQTIQDNTIENATTYALEIRRGNFTQVPIKGNIVKNCVDGIYISDNTKGTVTGNQIYNNKRGLLYRFHASGNIVNIYNNCIYDNSEYNFYNYSLNNCTLGPNWWGTVDSTQIDAKIYDYDDDFKIGYVYFTPFLSAKNQCISTTPPSASISEKLDLKSKFSAYPNPFSHTLTLTSDSQIKHITIYSIVGKQMLDVDIQTQKETTINTSSYPTGIYIYNTILDNGQKVSGKIVKQ